MVFDLVSDKIIKDVFKTLPKEFKFPLEDCSDPKKVQQAIDEQLELLCKGFADKAARAIGDEVVKASKLLDAATNDGTVGPKKGGKRGETEPATVENQAQAAKQVFTEYKQDFERPKQQETPSKKDK